MINPIPFIDPHVHADSRSVEEFSRLKTAGCKGILALSGPAGGFRSPDSLFDHFRRLDRVDRPRIVKSGLMAWIGLGIHPASIPKKRLDEALWYWEDAVEHYNGQAIGEIGLETCSDKEEQVLGRGFEVALQTNLPAIVHTPRTDKSHALLRTLAILEESKLAVDRVLLDHIDEEVVEMAIDSGCFVGLSVHPAKLTPYRVASLVAKLGAQRFVINTDMGANPSHLFGIPACISAMVDLEVEPATIQAVVYENGARLIGLDT